MDPQEKKEIAVGVALLGGVGLLAVLARRSTHNGVVTGTVMCPVSSPVMRVPPPPPSPCSAGVPVVAVDAAGAVAFAAVTDMHGTYTLTLPAGSYSVAAGSAHGVTVDVVAGTTQEVDLSIPRNPLIV